MAHEPTYMVIRFVHTDTHADTQNLTFIYIYRCVDRTLTSDESMMQNIITWLFIYGNTIFRPMQVRLMYKFANYDKGACALVVICACVRIAPQG